MNDIAIRVENLSKQFHIGALKKNRNFREALIDGLKAPFWHAAKLLQGKSTDAKSDETFWALKDVSFEIRRGETVGIIGGNGAGKSTLLKIISRITEPTGGFADIHGRVSSLLEVGTGFHPELTGRENIYLNGAILGMKKADIKRKYDEIVSFSGVEKFIDTPVKHYSSGMFLRLAFAVAAHLEPDILIVDEVLAVGDARFQKKCLDKMKEVGQEGRTVLFVSHSMQAITRLCKRAILLKEGYVLMDGPSHQVVGSYVSEGHRTKALREWPDSREAPGGNVARLRAVRVRAKEGAITESVDIRQPVFIEMEYDVLKEGFILLPHYILVNEEGVTAFGINDVDPVWRKRPRPVGRYVSRAVIPGNLLSEGTYLVEAALITLDPIISQFSERDVVGFLVFDSLDGDSARGDYAGEMDGIVRPLLEWKTVFNPSGEENAQK